MALREIKVEIQKKNFTVALRLMENLSEEQKSAEFYLLRGICVQIPNETEYSIFEAEASLRKAIELNPRYNDAKLELAYFLLNVLHDPSSAKKYFLEVLQATRDEVPDSISSFMESSHELKETTSSFANSLKIQTETILLHSDSKDDKKITKQK